MMIELNLKSLADFEELDPRVFNQVGSLSLEGVNMRPVNDDLLSIFPSLRRLEIIHPTGLEGSPSPLHLAAFLGHKRVVELLIEGELPVDYEINDETPLEHAILGQQFEVVQLLVQKGANIHRQDRDGFTPRDLAWTVAQNVLLNTERPER